MYNWRQRCLAALIRYRTTRHVVMTSREMATYARIEGGSDPASDRQSENETRRKLVSVSHLCLSVRFLTTHETGQDPLTHWRTRCWGFVSEVASRPNNV
jgi:hypothetical protein